MKKSAKAIPLRIELYRNRKGEWEWRNTVIRGGHIGGASTESYHNRAEAFYNLCVTTGFDGLPPARGDRSPRFIWEGYFKGRRRWVPA